MMVLAVVALVIPAIYAQRHRAPHPGHIESISLDISWVLMLTYAASLVLPAEEPRAPVRARARTRTHAQEWSSGTRWSTGKSLVVLLVRRRARGCGERVPRSRGRRGRRGAGARQGVHGRRGGGHRRQRGRALDGHPRGHEGQDGPVARHRHGLVDADRAVRGPGAGDRRPLHGHPARPRVHDPRGGGGHALGRGASRS